MSASTTVIKLARAKAPRVPKIAGQAALKSLLSIKTPSAMKAAKSFNLSAKTKSGRISKAPTKTTTSKLSSTLKSVLKAAKKNLGGNSGFPSDQTPSPANPPQPAFFGKVNPNAML